MPLDDDLYRMKRGRSLKDIKPPTLEAEFEKWQKKQFSHYPEKIHNLGTDSEGIPIYLTQEDRNDTHIHILGRPGQGKSKLLAKLITDDLRFGYGACLLDPSDNGDTMNKILGWCIKNRFEKVCIIDPHDIKLDKEGRENKTVPNIAPTHNLMETVRILFNNQDYETPRIQRYLPSVFAALRKAKCTIAELKYFTLPDDPKYTYVRNLILSKMH